MDKHVGRRLAMVRLAAVLAAGVQLGGCATGSMPFASWLDQPAPAATAQPALLEPAPLPGRTITAVPKSKPLELAAAARRAEAGPRAQVGRRAPGTLAWPVQGQILRAYGEQPSGARNDGLDIAAAEGSPVRAVEGGVVSYAGSDLPGYGNMLMITHADGLTSVYAHNGSLLVAVGANVDRGQPIATVGRSGAVVEAQLHFQLRAGNHPVDPQRYLEAPVTVVASLAPALAAPIGAR